jgi:hypothetical protein
MHGALLQSTHEGKNSGGNALLGRQVVISKSHFDYPIFNSINKRKKEVSGAVKSQQPPFKEESSRYD